MNNSNLIKNFEQLIFHFLCSPKENETKEKALFPRYFSAKLKTSFVLLKSFQGFKIF